MEIFDWKIFSAWGEHFQQSHSFLSRCSLLLEKNARTLVDNLIFSWFQLHFRYSAVSDINKLIFILRKFLADVFPSFPLLTYSSHSAAVSVFFFLRLPIYPKAFQMRQCKRESSCWIFLLIKFHFFFFCCFAFNTIFDPFLHPPFPSLPPYMLRWKSR